MIYQDTCITQRIKIGTQRLMNLDWEMKLPIKMKIWFREYRSNIDMDKVCK